MNRINTTNIVNKTTDNETAVFMCEEEYEGLIETAFLNLIPNLAEDILKAKEELISECARFDIEEVW